MAKKKSKPRISSSANVFNAFVARTDDRLQGIEPASGNPYWQFYGLTSTNATDWANKRQFFTTPGTGLYALYSNPLTSSSPIKKQVKQFIKDFRAFGSPLLNIIAASPNATSDDEEIFNLVLNKNRKKPTHSHTKIADACYTDWTGSGGGNMKAASRSETDSSRHSLAEGADGVQYATMILDDTPENIATAIAAAQQANNAAAAARAANPATIVPTVPIPVAPPQHPDDGTTQEFFSGASHQFILGAANKGKYLYTWSRWYNSKHPELAGDWNARQVILIV